SRGSSEAARGRQTRAALVVVEIVLALILLASAGLLVESFLRLQRVQPGFDPTNVMTARIALSDSSYGKPAQAAEFYKKLLARVSTLPGVNSVAAAWWIPLSGSEIVFSFDIEERPLPKSQQASAQVNAVTYDYFKTMRTSIGREPDRQTHHAKWVARTGRSASARNCRCRPGRSSDQFARRAEAPDLHSRTSNSPCSR